MVGSIDSVVVLTRNLIEVREKGLAGTFIENDQMHSFEMLPNEAIMSSK